MSGRTDYERALARELTVVGITGSRRGRILDEIADHLSIDPQARLGEPQALARDFADVVGTARVKVAALVAFLALAVAGLLCAGVFLATPNGLLRAVQRVGSPGYTQAPPTVGVVAAFVLAVAGQVAFAAGCLALLRWWWRRDRGVLPAAEAAVLLRRALVGVGAGVVAMVALGVIAGVVRHQVGTLSSDAGLIAAALGLVALASTVPALSAAARVKPTAPGESGDIFDDLGPVVPGDLRGHPWRLAVLFAIAVAVVITLAAVPAQDVYDGALRGLLDAAACLVGFAVLGPFLGLWQPARPARPDRPAAA